MESNSIQILRRLLASVGILFLVFAGSRALVRLLPGDPIQTLLDQSGTTLSIDAVREDLGLDRPYLPSLIEDTKKALHGDWGRSLLSQQPIAKVLRSRIYASAQLTLLALLIGVFFSLSIGLPAASARAGQAGTTIWASVSDKVCTIHGALMASLPIPWVGPLLIYALAVVIPLFPATGSVFLPAFLLALTFSGFWARLIRERVSETLVLGSARAAHARGLPAMRVLIKYGLIPCCGPLLGYFGTQMGALLSGVFLSEVIFNWPGMGSLLVDSVLRRDYPTIEAATFFAAFFSLMGTALGDIAQTTLQRRSGEQ